MTIFDAERLPMAHQTVLHRADRPQRACRRKAGANGKTLVDAIGIIRARLAKTLAGIPAEAVQGKLDAQQLSPLFCPTGVREP